MTQTPATPATTRSSLLSPGTPARCWRSSCLGLPADAPRSRRLPVAVGGRRQQPGASGAAAVCLDEPGDAPGTRVVPKARCASTSAKAELAWHTAGTLRLQACLPYAAPAAVAKLVARFVAGQ
ncbi:hypothetical protein ACU4GD_07830 [Cupriavidus basilensis]